MDGPPPLCVAMDGPPPLCAAHKHTKGKGALEEEAMAAARKKRLVRNATLLAWACLLAVLAGKRSAIRRARRAR